MMAGATGVNATIGQGNTISNFQGVNTTPGVLKGTVNNNSIMGGNLASIAPMGSTVINNNTRRVNEGQIDDIANQGMD